MAKINLKTLTTLAILTALSVVLGMFFHLKTPTGVLTLLDGGIFFAAFYFGKKEGFIVGALSGFLFDLFQGYPEWMLVSLLAHGLQGFFAGWSRKYKLLGLVISSISMIGLYFLVSIGLYNLGEALDSLSGNVLQNFVGMFIGYVLSSILKKRLS